jgi:hypothetical protein
LDERDVAGQEFRGPALLLYLLLIRDNAKTDRDCPVFVLS